MKTLLTFAALGLAFVYQAGAQAPQVGPGSVKLGKVSPAVVKTPEFQIVGGQNKRSKNGNWLEVEVEFATAPEEIDELTFNFVIGVEKKLLDGTVTHITIPKDREHFTVMYVAPRVLDKLTGGKPLTSGSIDNVWVTVTHQGQLLDSAAFHPGPIPNLPHLSGMVLNKNETPFAPLYFDRYEAIKANR